MTIHTTTIRLTTMLLSFHILSCLNAQNLTQNNSVRKTIVATRVQDAPKIDGLLNENVWQNASIAEDFVERSPENGKNELNDYRTKVKVLFDDKGVYFGAQLFDPYPQNIATELTERDIIGNNDIFAITINGYDDSQQSLLFQVHASGVQADAKIVTNQSNDYKWNAVWYSAVKINNDGWTVEIKIPYSELRFPKNDIQSWGINFIRIINKTNQNLTWNFVDNKRGNYLQYDGLLTGIDHIKPPLRLSFMPYASTYVNNYDGKTTADFVAGMDMKYGINDAFTLDMTLIPDFGQTNFDATILNLGPFEQQLAEQRSFFTEGTELFNIGNLFYSRRIGGAPSKTAEINDNEKLVYTPENVKLFNAFKVSGRSANGLGIGLFNGITEKAEAEIININSGEKRKEVVEPWTNYNVLVLNQRFNGNSSVSFVNTNVLRPGDFRDANASGLEWVLKNKLNTYQLYGSLKSSWVRDNVETFGSKGHFGLGKNAGKHQWDVNGNYTTEKWDINDLGYSTQTNYANYNAWYGYRLLKPNKKFNNIYVNNNIYYYHRLDSYAFTNFILHHNSQFTDKHYRTIGGGLEFTPLGANDFFEPRVAGRYLKIPAYLGGWLWYESDSRKKLKYTLQLDYYKYLENSRNNVKTTSQIRYRASDKFNLSWQFNALFNRNETGYAAKTTTDIIMGIRDRNSFENVLSSQYTFNDKMILSLAFRHYFSDVTYKDFYTLTQEGKLAENSGFSENIDGTYNSWNIDLRYSWRFAPGSQLTLLYRNAVQNYIDVAGMNVSTNFNRLFNEPLTNNLSLRLTYYLDVALFRK